MKFKMRMLHYPEQGAAQQLAVEIAKSQDVNLNLVDKIPPAYNLEKERLVFIGVEKTNLKAVNEFCKQLSPERVKNVAFFTIGGASVDEHIQLVGSKGITVKDTLRLDAKGGLFKKASITPDDIKKTLDWAAGIVDSLAN